METVKMVMRRKALMVRVMGKVLLFLLIKIIASNSHPTLVSSQVPELGKTFISDPIADIYSRCNTAHRILGVILGYALLYSKYKLSKTRLNVRV